MSYPNTFASQAGPIALSKLDANFNWAVDIQNQALVANAGGSADAITATYTPAPTALVNGLTLYVRAALANATTAPTFSPNSLTATPIVKANGTVLSPGDIAGAGHWLQLTYDTTLTSWVLNNPEGLEAKFTSTGLNNTPVGATTPSTGAFTTLSASSGLNSTAVGNTTPSTGAFTTLSASGTATFGGTASGETVTISQTGNNQLNRIAFADSSGNYATINAFGSAYGSGVSGVLRLTASGGVADLSSTGLSVTGALSSTGAISTTSASGFVATVASGNTGYALTSGANSWSTYINGADGSYRLYSGSDRAIFSTTGLAVTGALSASGGATSNVLALSATTDPYATVTDGTYKYVCGTGNSTNFSGSFSNHAYAIRVNNTEVSRWDTAGNLGLGVVPSANAGAKSLHVANYNGAASAVSLGGSGGDYGSVGYNIGFTNTAGSYKALITDGMSWLRFTNGSFQFWQQASATAGTTYTGTQSMTLDASGNLLVGAYGTGTAAGGTAIIPSTGATYQNIGHVTGTASGSAYEQFLYNGTTIGSITQSGTTAVLYNTTSDQRLKENIKDADSANPLIDQIQVRQYDWKSDGSHQRYGFVAQELVQVFPEAVHQPENPEDMMAVDYSKLVPLLLKEVQELRARLNAAGIA